MTSTVDAVHLIARPDGYFGNAAVKILVPRSFGFSGAGLHTAGCGPQVDKFVC